MATGITVFSEPTQGISRRLEVFGRENDAAQAERSRKMLNFDRETANLIHLLLRMSRRTQVLEIGTSNGYSTIWLAATVSQTGGKPIISIERDADKLAEARKNLTEAGLADRVQLVHGDASAAVAILPGPFDCVFFDADRVSAPDQLRRLYPKLTADALLLADNALSHQSEIQGYREFTTMTVPVGKGLHVAWRPF